jgi:hypothetical protein
MLNTLFGLFCRYTSTWEEWEEPLWVYEKNIPTPEQIPPCSHCGSKRLFEFQVITLSSFQNIYETETVV